VTDFSRRAFAESLALATLAPLIGVRPETIRLRHWHAAAPRVGTDPPGKLAEALTDAVRAQYGTRLSAKDLETIATQIQTGLERMDKLRKVELANGDEPDFVFSAVRRAPPLP
jgi:hypothetical protein